MSASPETLFESQLTTLPLLHRGKVRDIYHVDDRHLLIVTTDRLSAFDVILPDPIPGKGALLTALSAYWFNRTRHIVPNHLQLAERDLDQIGLNPDELHQVRHRAMVVRRLQALPIEAVVRGYLIGSGWTDYQRSGSVCGVELPPGLRLAEALDRPIYTPSSKAAAGEHDQNISFGDTKTLIGSQLASAVRDAALHIYAEAWKHAAHRGILIADTKFEFGIDEKRQLVLIDEVLTPDSSRFWPTDEWRPGSNPPSFDKQFVRDYLGTLDWNKKAPGPHLPADVIECTANKYREALARLTTD